MKDKQFKNLIKEALTPDFLKEQITEEFDYMKDSDGVRDLFKVITGKSGVDDLDSDMFSAAEDINGRGGWMLNIDDSNLSSEMAAKFVKVVMELGKKKGWKMQQYGDDAIEIFEKEPVNEDRFGDVEHMFSGEDEKTPVLVDVWYAYHEEHGYGGVYKVKVYFNDKSIETFDSLKDAEAKYDLEGVKREETEFDVS